MLEEAISKDFGLQIKVLILSIEEIRKIIHSIPDTWKNDHEMESDVMFLWEEADVEFVLENLPVKPNVDTVFYVPGAILWSVNRKNQAKSGQSKIIGTTLYKQMTIRNVNTARKILELMESVRRMKLTVLT